MRLVIFGATGKTGEHVVQQALDQGHEVVAFARTPSKVKTQHQRLTVMQGDVQNVAKVDEAVANADAVVSVLGPTSNTPDHQVTKGMQHILAGMKNHGVRRLVMSAGAGVGFPKDEPKLINHFISFLLHTTARHVVEDMKNAVAKVRDSDLDWTIVRVPMLTDQPATGNLKVGYVGKGTGARLSRADMASFMLRQVTDTRYVCDAPVISN